MAAVFAWVADCLADPLHTYELVLPSRQPLEPRPQSGGWVGRWGGRVAQLGAECGQWLGSVEPPSCMPTCSAPRLPLSTQTVREADLLPSVALLFRWTGQSALDMAHVPALRPDLLRGARPAQAAY